MRRNPIGKALAWTVGLAAAAAVGVTALVLHNKGSSSPSPAPTQTGTTMSVALSSVSGQTQDNLGIVALPIGATLVIAAPQGGSVGNVAFTEASAKVAAQTGTAVSIQWTTTAPGPTQAQISWTDPNNGQQVSTVQIVPEVSSAVIGLMPGTMPNLYLPASSSTVTGEMLFVPPSQQPGDTQTPVLSSTGSSVSGPAASGALYSGSYGIVAAANGVSMATIAWVNGAGQSVTSTFYVIVVPQ